ncbi:MAG: hypothetical protein K2O95_05635 [Clostridia bacterium]|nr:hypothetical protein [Clostridia bacterium]
MTEQPVERIHVCYCGNEKVFPLILLSAISIAKYTTAPVSLYIVTANLTRINPKFIAVDASRAQILTEVLQKSNPESVAKVIDATDLYENALGGSKSEKSKYTPYSYLRMLLPTLDLNEKIIYLDSDTMCCSDLAQLWDIDISQYEFAAVRDHMGQHFFGRDYINSGVLYLNFDMIGKSGLFDRGIEKIKNKRLFFPDQTVLNKYGKRILRLPRKFNEQRGAREGETVIKHFCQGIKWVPFHVYNIKQSERRKVRENLGIDFFEDIYAIYDELQAKYNFEKGRE